MDSNFLLVVLLLVLGFGLLLFVFLMRLLSNFLPYLYATARIRAKEARLLKPETMEELVNTGSLAEIASLLENTEYALAMQGLVLENAESIERLLERQTADIYSEVAGMLPDKVQPVFAYLQQQWDVRNIKTLLRGLRSSLTAEKIMASVLPFGTLDVELLRKMSEASGIEDVLPLFEATPYSALAQQLQAYEQTASLLPLESTLDKVLLETMWLQVEAGGPLQILQPFFAARIDALNIKIMMRAKRDHLLLSDIEPYIISSGHASQRLIRAFDEVDDVSALASELEGSSYYKPVMDALADYDRHGSLFALEKVLDETALAIGRDTAVTQPYGIAPVLGFLARKDVEVRNIRAISRAKEAGLAPEYIRELVLNV
jgi:V/A-type H+/Na+-transporting ATPase subunit C